MVFIIDPDITGVTVLALSGELTSFIKFIKTLIKILNSKIKYSFMITRRVWNDINRCYFSFILHSYKDCGLISGFSVEMSSCLCCLQAERDIDTPLYSLSSEKGRNRLQEVVLNVTF